MFLRCQRLLQAPFYGPRSVLLTNTTKVQTRTFSQQTISNVYRLCRMGMESCSWEFVPFIRQSFRQIDYVAAQKLKRGQQWIRFYTQLWSRERLSCLLTQMGRRLGIAFRHRRISQFILGGAAFVPSVTDVEIVKCEEVKRGKARHTTETQASHTQFKR